MQSPETVMQKKMGNNLASKKVKKKKNDCEISKIITKSYCYSKKNPCKRKARQRLEFRKKKNVNCEQGKPNMKKRRMGSALIRKVRRKGKD